jgi:DNA-directed RNA polymerase subunit K/omega
MKKAKSRVQNGLRRSYKRSDFPGGFIRGKYAARLAAGSNVVVLTPENAAAFPTSDAVNEALTGLVRVAKSARLTSRSSGRRSR